MMALIHRKAVEMYRSQKKKQQHVKLIIHITARMTTRKTPVGFCCSCTSVDVRKAEGERLCGRLQSTQLGDYLVTRCVIKFLGKIPVSVTSKSDSEWRNGEKKNPKKKVPRVEEMRRWQPSLPGGAELDHPSVATGHFIHPLFSHDWQNKSQFDASGDWGWICLCLFSHEDTNTRQQFVMRYEHSEPPALTGSLCSCFGAVS